MSKPLAVVRRGGISFTAWPGKNGWTWTLRKQYKSQDTGQYIESKTFFPNECDKVVEGVQELVNTMKGKVAEEKPMRIDPLPQGDVFDDGDDIPF